MMLQCLRPLRGTRFFREFTSCAPLLQAKKKKDSGGPAAAAVESFDLKVQIPVNLLKGMGQHASAFVRAILNVSANLLRATEGPEPEYKPISEYPEWLAKIVDDKPLILEDYIMRGMENVPEDKVEQVFRTANKRRIKEANAAKRKQD